MYGFSHVKLFYHRVQFYFLTRVPLLIIILSERTNGGPKTMDMHGAFILMHCCNVLMWQNSQHILPTVLWNSNLRSFPFYDNTLPTCFAICLEASKQCYGIVSYLLTIQEEIYSSFEWHLQSSKLRELCSFTSKSYPPRKEIRKKMRAFFWYPTES